MFQDRQKSIVLDVPNHGRVVFIVSEDSCGELDSELAHGGWKHGEGTAAELDKVLYALYGPTRSHLCAQCRAATSTFWPRS